MNDDQRNTSSAGTGAFRNNQSQPDTDSVSKASSMPSSASNRTSIWPGRYHLPISVAENKQVRAVFSYILSKIVLHKGVARPYPGVGRVEVPRGVSDVPANRPFMGIDFFHDNRGVIQRVTHQHEILTVIVLVY